MNGNGELTETENVIFYVSYGVLTELLRMNVFLTHFAAATATVTAKDMECWMIFLQAGFPTHFFCSLSSRFQRHRWLNYRLLIIF